MNRKRLVYTTVPLLVLVVATFACVPSEAKPTVVIKAPPNGSQVAVGQTVEVLFSAEDAQAVMWVQMTVDDAVVATQQSPLAGGQTPFEGILRWTPSKIGTVNLVVTAHSAGDQDSDPAAVSISVVEAVAGAPTLTPVPTPKQPAQPSTRPTATKPPGQPTATRPPGQPTATPTATKPPGQPTPTPTATKPPGQPTSTPTKTPAPTPVVPVIDDFSVDKEIIDLSECATLSWQTTNATEVYLGPDPVPEDGSREFCAGDLGGPGTTMFELRAVHGSEEVSEFESITVEESQQEETLIEPFFPAMSGSVADDGTVFSSIYPGDNDSNHGFRSYITFDLASLPSAAVIKSAVLDLGPCTETGDPFTDLAGQLYVSWIDYETLDGSDYHATGGEYLGSVYGCPGGNIDVTASVDANKGRSHYQIGLGWPVESDFDGQTDDVTYTSPVLYITFERP
jgi:hypothetical protein